ncbi:unnamed protein product [Rotaria socialis]|uniref:Uncharacterized protein n=3 Tax=Rotaria socialis TaxID=392032 RepID=A0A821G410_9BILA|nr:unnamed protein product [Rotaria socialis]CAF4663321.1 unnamed protein product [Rotaria socialis]
MSKDTNRKNSFTEDISLVWKLDDITYFDHDPIEESSIAEKHLNLENFVVIWLDDQFVDKRSRDVVRAQVNYLEVFYDVDQCVDEISEIDTDKIFLIVSENYFNQLALILESFEQVHSVYILCYNQDIYNMYMIHDFALSEYRKLAGYFIDIDQISHAIRKRKAQYARESIEMVSIPRRSSGVAGFSYQLDKLEASVMYFQLIKDILISMAHGENARAELINLFRAYFHDNTNGLRKVEEFERDYRPEDAILWYTKESFIYTTLNKALRIQDISTLHKMRCFIADIHHQLDYLCRQSNYTSNFEVYRGQCMSTHDFQKHSRNVGGLISFNSLLSCSEDHRVALLYANSQDRNDSIVPVLLHIIVNPGVRNTAFSNIIAVSGFGDIEQEFLFSMGAIFRILSIQRYNQSNRIQEFCLLLTNDEDKDLKDVREYMRQEIGGTNHLINFGRLLIEMGDLNQSERFYKIVLREAYANHDPRIIAWIYNDLGFIASQNGFKEKGLQFYKKALRIGQERFPLQDPQLAPILNNIGEFYFDSEDFDKADEYYRKALEIDMKSTAPALYNQAIRYQNIGMVYNEKQNYKDAQKNFKKSLDKKMSILPQKHPSIAITHRSISGVYCSQGRFTEALQHCQAALAIERSSLPPYHVSLSKTHQCMARIYLGQEQFMNAQKEIVEALDIAKKTLPEQHKIILAIKDDMVKIFRKTKA